MAFNLLEMLSNFTSIIYEALPFIVIGVVIAGLLEEFVPQQAIARIMPRNKYLAIALGGVLGLIFPMCECGIIVVMKRLLRKGLPLSVCVCYMLAGPVINVVVMLSTFVAFDYPDPKSYILGGPLGMVAAARAVFLSWWPSSRPLSSTRNTRNMARRCCIRPSTAACARRTTQRMPGSPGGTASIT